jgi:hypothetical protein
MVRVYTILPSFLVHHYFTVGTLLSAVCLVQCIRLHHDGVVCIASSLRITEMVVAHPILRSGSALRQTLLSSQQTMQPIFS